MKKTCPDVNHGLYVRRLSSTTASIGFCCLGGTINTVEEIDFKQDRKLVSLRNKFAVDPESVRECGNCWYVENNGGQSRRQGMINWYQDRNISTTEDPSLVNLDYNTENVCNLQCLTCSPMFSSSWVPLAKKMGLPTSEKQSPHAKNNQSILDLDLSNVRRVYFNGGEPFLTGDHEFILSKINEQNGLGEVDVQYNTNGTVIPSEATFELWDKARLVKIMLSVDAIGDAFDFIRAPAKWEQVIKTVETITTRNPHVMIDVTFTMGLHNIFYLDDTLSWFETGLPNKLGDPTLFNLQPVGASSYGGKVLSLDNLPDSARITALKSLTLAKTYSFWPMIETMLTQPIIGSIEDAIKYLDGISEHRRVHWSLPLSRLYDTINLR